MQKKSKAPVALRVVRDANRGWPELRKRNPKLYEEFTRKQREVASKVHREPPESIRHMRF